MTLKKVLRNVLLTSLILGTFLSIFGLVVPSASQLARMNGVIISTALTLAASLYFVFAEMNWKLASIPLLVASYSSFLMLLYVLENGVPTK